MSIQLEGENKNILKHVRSLLKYIKKPELTRLRNDIFRCEKELKEMREGSPEYNQKNKELQQRRSVYRSTVNDKYNDLAYCYPAIFNLLLDQEPEKFEMAKLIEMLRLRQNIQNKKTAKESKTECENATKYIGQKYFNEYVKPMVNDKEQPSS